MTTASKDFDWLEVHSAIKQTWNVIFLAQKVSKLGHFDGWSSVSEAAWFHSFGWDDGLSIRFGLDYNLMRDAGWWMMTTVVVVVC